PRARARARNARPSRTPATPTPLARHRSRARTPSARRTPPRSAPPHRTEAARRRRRRGPPTASLARAASRRRHGRRGRRARRAPSPRTQLHPTGRPPPGTDLLENRLEQVERGEHVLARQHAGAFFTAHGERVLDRLVLALVLKVELVDRLVTRRPDRRPGERATRTLCHLLDVRQIGDAVDDVVEAVVALHPLDGERAAVVTRLARTQRARQPSEALLGLPEPLDVGPGELLRRNGGDG